MDTRLGVALHLGSWTSTKNTTPYDTSILRNVKLGLRIGQVVCNNIIKGNWTRDLEV
jgi:hypothetical protein